MIHSRNFDYSDGDMVFEGVVAYNDATTADRPIVLVAPTFRGQTEFENAKAVRLAEMGYIGFAIDTYGKGVRGNTAEEAKSLMDTLNSDRSLLLKRMQLSMKVARNFPMVDTSKIGAIGYCFGGKSVLDLARSGEDLAGVVSFHGVLDPPGINQDVEIKTKVLVLHGWDDPLATPAQTVALAQELTDKKAVWELAAYGHTGHAFTNPQANSPGMAFNQLVDDRSWDRMASFFKEVFS